MLIIQLYIRLLCILRCGLAVHGTNGGFPNNLGVTPPMGWRSWNAFRENINQSILTDILHGLVSATHVQLGSTTPVSLAQIGYSSLGIDDGWEACGQGVNGSFHNATGFPLIDTTLFPNMSQLVGEAHAVGLTMGW